MAVSSPADLIGSLEVVDLNEGKRIRRISGLKKPQGIAVVTSVGCLVVACGDENSVHVYGLADLAARAVTVVGQNADNVRSDGTNLVYVGFGPDQGPGRLAVYVFKMSAAGGLSKVASVHTSPHARTGFFVPQRRAVYIVCPPAGAEDAKVLEFSLGSIALR